MSDESDSYDHEKEKLLSENIYQILRQREDLLTLVDKLRDVGLDSMADKFEKIGNEIYKNSDEIRNRFVYCMEREKVFQG